MRIAHQYVSNKKQKLFSIRRIRRYQPIVLMVVIKISAKSKDIQIMIFVFGNNILNLWEMNKKILYLTKPYVIVITQGVLLNFVDVNDKEKTAANNVNVFMRNVKTSSINPEIAINSMRSSYKLTNFFRAN